MRDEIREKSRNQKTKKINDKTNELFSKTAMKKLEQFAMLYEMAWELKRAALSKKYPNLDNNEINKMTAQIFALART